MVMESFVTIPDNISKLSPMRKLSGMGVRFPVLTVLRPHIVAAYQETSGAVIRRMK